MHDSIATDDGRTADENSDLSANRFGLDADDVEELLDVDTDDVDALLDAADATDVDALLDVDTGDVEELLDVDTDDVDALLDDMADHWAEEVARQWDTPAGEWWP